MFHTPQVTWPCQMSCASFAASIPKPVAAASLSAVLPKTDVSTSDNVASTTMTRSDTQALSVSQGGQVSGEGDMSLAIVQQIDTDSAENLLKTSIMEEVGYGSCIHVKFQKCQSRRFIRKSEDLEKTGIDM